MTTTTQHSTSARTAGRSADGNHDKFLTFCLGQEEYGLPILSVREIIGLVDVTPLPQSPPSIKGVINLRGKIIPVMELRARFGMPSVSDTPETCILVVEVTGQDGATGPFQLGVIVDTVREVLDIDRASIEPPPNCGSSTSSLPIQGMGKVKDKVVILLSADDVGAASEFESVAARAEASGSSNTSVRRAG